MKEVEQEMEEARVRYELEIDDLKLTNLNILQKLRALQDDSQVAAVFALYERDIGKL